MGNCCRRKAPCQGDEWVVYLNSRQTQESASNEVTTSKYTCLNFLPKNLWEQFQKTSNVYFIVICALQCIPAISTTSGTPTLALPLAVVVLVNAIKDAYEDVQRHKSDRLENLQVTHCLPRDAADAAADTKHANKQRQKALAALAHLKKSLLSRELDAIGSDSDEDDGVLLQQDAQRMQQEQQQQDAERERLRRLGLLARNWKDVKLGDIVVCFKNEAIAADLVLLGSSDPKGLAFIETSSLDGETNLKLKQTAKGDIFSMSPSLKTAVLKVGSFEGHLVCKHPNRDIGTFEGLLFVKQNSHAASAPVSPAVGESPTPSSKQEPSKAIPLAYSQILLRGCKLRNTDWVIGLVVYTGKQTKIQMNSGAAPRKMSRVERLTNRLTLAVWGLQMLLCFLSAFLHMACIFWVPKREFYQIFANGGKQSPAMFCIVSFFTWMVLTCNMVPISLVVQMGMVKALQAFFIFKDKDMMSETGENSRSKAIYLPGDEDFAAAAAAAEGRVPLSSNGDSPSARQQASADGSSPVRYASSYGNRSASPDASHGASAAAPAAAAAPVTKDTQCQGAWPRTSDLNEELGQVSYLFSDKTGTLTKNVMEFRKCCIKGVSYGKGITEIRRQVLRRLGKPVPPEPQLLPSEKETPYVRMVDKHLREHLANPMSPCHSHALSFFLHLAINHSVICEAEEQGGTTYGASSPDERALVYSAHHFGVSFLGRNSEGLSVSVLGRKTDVRVLCSIEFTSRRKRSSVLVEILFPESGEETAGSQAEDSSERSGAAAGRFKRKIILFTKGADTVLLPLLAEVGPLEREMIATMEDYAQDGLRTLCIAKREIPADEFVRWFKLYEEAENTNDNRQEIIERVADMLEHDLELQGITGVEDKLQDDVGPTIEKLRKAGIKVWMLTGDKVDTAINIAIATSLLTTSMQRSVYVWEELDCNKDNVFDKLQEDLKSLAAERRLFRNNKRSFIQERKERALIVDGEALAVLLEPDLSKKFAALCTACKAVICSRVTPYQKGAVVSLIKMLTGEVTLAIGDGANDCNMIQAANVGVGLRGQEGMQAFNTSDYGLSQFSFLQHLLLVHGRWNYRRVSRLVLYMFYKNMVLVLPMFFYGIFSLFSAQKFYFEFLYQMYNVVFTAIPITLYGVLDQDVDKHLCLRYPQLYRSGHSHFYLNFRVFLSWMLTGIWHAAVVFVVPAFSFGYNIIPMLNGQPFDIWMVGMLVFALNMLVVNVKVLMETSYLTPIIWAGFFISLLAFILFFFGFSSWPVLAGSVLGNVYYVFISAAPSSLICMAVGPTLCLLRDWIWKTFKVSLRPELYHVIQQTEYLKDVEFASRVGLVGRKQQQKPYDSEYNAQPPEQLNEGEKHPVFLTFDRCLDELPSEQAQSPSPAVPFSVAEDVTKRPSTARSGRYSGYAFSEADPAFVSVLHADGEEPKGPKEKLCAPASGSHQLSSSSRIRGRDPNGLSNADEGLGCVSADEGLGCFSPPSSSLVSECSFSKI